MTENRTHGAFDIFSGAFNLVCLVGISMFLFSFICFRLSKQAEVYSFNAHTGCHLTIDDVLWLPVDSYDPITCKYFPSHAYVHLEGR